MNRKYLVAFCIILVIASCKPSEQPPTEPTATATSATTATTPTETGPTATMPPPKPPLDHFKFWKITPRQYQETLWLYGQADSVFWEAAIGNAEYLGNPVDKQRIDDPNKSAKINGKVHYVVYALKAKKEQPWREVVLTNQFTNDRETWTITQPKWLLTPAGKTRDGSPERQSGDHFVCYDVYKGKRFQVSTVLVDQFDLRRSRKEEIRELQPAYFCIPVQKRRKTEPEKDLIDKDTHLALYKLNPQQDRDKWPQAPPYNAIDQFMTEPQKLEPLYSDWLGVPSVKYGKPKEITQPQ